MEREEKRPRVATSKDMKQSVLSAENSHPVNLIPEKAVSSQKKTKKINPYISLNFQLKKRVQNWPSMMGAEN